MNSLSPQLLGLAGGPVTLVAGADPGTGAERPRAATPRRLARQAWRRRWILLGGLAAGALAGLLVTALTPRQYASTVRLQIARETAQVLTVGAISHEVSIGDQEFYQTQYGLLRSQALAERVARDAGLADAPAFFAMFHRDVDMSGKPGSPEFARRNALAGQILLDHVQVAPVRGSSLVDIEAKTPSPELSRKVAQAWGQDFIANSLQRRLDASSYARQFLETRLEQLRQRLEQSEHLAVEYAASHGIIDLPGPGSSPDAAADAGRARSLVTEDLVTLNAARDAAVAERIQAAARLQASGDEPGATGTALENRAINLLRRDRAAAAAEVARLSAQAAPDTAALKTDRARVAALDAAIGKEEARVRTSLQQTYQAAASREQALTQRVDALKGSLTELRRRAIQYNIYQRDADTNRALYEGLLQRYKEISVASALGSSNVAIVDAAETPERPASPRPAVNLALCLLAGAILGAGGAILAERLDDTVREPDEAEAKLGLPLLGATATLKAGRALDALQDPRSPLAEAYLAVQANLELAASHGAPRSLAVVSARLGEGRTTTAIALARILARAGRTVALVDADLRSPSLHTAFGLRNAAGLGDLLTGGAILSAVLQTSDQEGLAVITAGTVPANPAGLLLGERLTAVINQLLDRFDHVVLDSPPAAAFADAPLIAAAAQGAVCVVRAAVTSAGEARSALARLAGAQVAGAVLTMTRPRPSSGRS